MCGICDNDTENDCVQDCDGTWGGDLVVDLCGICGGTDECLGCTGPDSCNYDPEATIDDGSCIYPNTGYNCEGDMIDCAGETYISIIDNQGFAQVAESSSCTQYTLTVLLK